MKDNMVSTNELVHRIVEISKEEGKPLSLAEVKTCIACMKQATAEYLRQGKRVQVTGFFSMGTTWRDSRTGRNIWTSENITIPGTVVVSVRTGSDIRSCVRDLPEDLVEEIKQRKKK